MTHLVRRHHPHERVQRAEKNDRPFAHMSQLSRPTPDAVMRFIPACKIKPPGSSDVLAETFLADGG